MRLGTRILAGWWVRIGQNDAKFSSRRRHLKQVGPAVSWFLDRFRGLDSFGRVGPVHRATGQKVREQLIFR
jgi:hypothetical protein